MVSNSCCALARCWYVCVAFVPRSCMCVCFVVVVAGVSVCFVDAVAHMHAHEQAF